MDSDMQRCPFCGQPVQPGSNNCPFCGAPLVGGADEVDDEGVVAGAPRVTGGASAAGGTVAAAHAAPASGSAPAGSPARPVAGSHAASARKRGSATAAFAGDRRPKTKSIDAMDASDESSLFSLDALEGDAGVNPNSAANQTPKKESARLKKIGGAAKSPIAKRIGIVVGAVLVAAIVVGVGYSWNQDQALKSQAQEVSVKKKKAESKLDLMGGDTKIKAEAKAGLGGSGIVCDGSYFYWADSQGIRVRKASGTKVSKAAVLTKADARELNVCGGSLYYASGSDIMEIDHAADAAKDALGKGKAKVKVSTVATLESDVQGLAVRGGTVVAMTTKDGKACVWRVDDSSPKLIAAEPANSAWFFADSQNCDLIVDVDSGWTVCEAPLTDVKSAGEVALATESADEEAKQAQETHGPFSSYVAGSEQLKDAFFTQGTLYAVLSSSDGHTTLSRCTQGGTFSSFDDYATAGELWGNKHGCAVVLSSGKLGWIDATSGLSSDYDKVAEKAGLDLDPASTSLWLNGTTLYVLDGSGKSATLWALDTAADSPKLTQIAR